MELIVIAAVAKNRVIGINNQLPWHLPEDLKHFRELTRGCAVIMGRKTWESLPDAFRPLPGRRNIVLSRQRGLNELPLFKGAEIEGSLDAACGLLNKEATTDVTAAFVIGGADIYQQAMSIADRLEITEVDAEPAGDAWFPVIDASLWRETHRAPGDGFAFVSYKRR